MLTISKKHILTVIDSAIALSFQANYATTSKKEVAEIHTHRERLWKLRDNVERWKP